MVTSCYVAVLNDAGTVAWLGEGERTPQLLALPAEVIWTAIHGDEHTLLVAGSGRRVLLIDTKTRVQHPLSGPKGTSDVPLVAVHGSAADFIACGFGGEIWRVSHERWKRVDYAGTVATPLCAIAPGETNEFYIVGRNGALLQLVDGSARLIEWRPPSHPETNLLRGLGDLWGVAWFQSRLYVSSLRGVYTIDLDTGEPTEVDFGLDVPVTTYGLATDGERLVSWGGKSVLVNEGEQWMEIP
jgi:hypothetical protein